MMSTSGKENSVEIDVEGEGNLMYQVSGSYYLPWDKLAAYPELPPIRSWCRSMWLTTAPSWLSTTQWKSM